MPLFLFQVDEETAKIKARGTFEMTWEDPGLEFGGACLENDEVKASKKSQDYVIG